MVKVGWGQSNPERYGAAPTAAGLALMDQRLAAYDAMIVEANRLLAAGDMESAVQLLERGKL